MRAARDCARRLLLPASAGSCRGTRASEAARPDFHRSSGLRQPSAPGGALTGGDFGWPPARPAADEKAGLWAVKVESIAAKATDPGLAQVWRVGSFRFAPAHQTLFEGDRQVRLGSRAIEILRVLVERAGTLVTKDELIAGAWPNLFVAESTLRVHIAALRKALGDGRGSRGAPPLRPGRGNDPSFTILSRSKAEPLMESRIVPLLGTNF
jgi:hypothetical protein